MNKLNKRFHHFSPPFPMNFATAFVPTAGEAGMVPLLTYFFMTVAAYCFFGNAFFSVLTDQSVAPEHRISRASGGVIAVVAGVLYLLITRFYHGMLQALSHLTSPETRLAPAPHAASDAVPRCRLLAAGVRARLARYMPGLSFLIRQLISQQLRVRKNCVLAH
jgi:amino acid transporter